MVDGMSFSVHVPYSGSKILFDCQATTSLMCGYPDISLADREFLLDFEYDLSETDDDGWKIQFERELKERLDIICRGVEFTNADLASHNCGLRQRIMTALNARKKSAERFYKVVETIQIPLYKVNGAEVVIPLKKRIIPIAHTYDQEPTYRIDDSAYNDIISVIKHNCATWERTPASYKSLEEEDLRNVLLAGLNGVFQGRANGETFRYKGKTDICIEEESRSAFVAECKMWNGEKKIQEALLQLDGYLTWRDCKTALIYFVRRKDFIAIVNKVQSALLGIDCLTNVQQIDKNEVSCFMDSFSTPGQRKRVRILFFNLDHSGQEVT